MYLIHYPDGMVYEPVHSADGQYLGTPVYDGSSVVLLAVSFTESVIRIMRFLHQQVEVQEVARLPLSEVKDCYNLISGLNMYGSQSMIEKHLISVMETNFTSMFGMKTQTIVKKRWCVLCMTARFWKGFRGMFVLCRMGKDGL